MSRIVLFSGGTACRSINFALCKTDLELTRVVPAWDSGGSSKVIREMLPIVSVGDIRQALMTMAHGEGCAGDVVKICNARLSGGTDIEAPRREFAYYAAGHHPLLERMEPGLRSAILNYLGVFSAQAGADFDFRNGSIGNFILTGAYIAHNCDINTAIFVFRKICGIRGNVWPSSALNGVELGAVLANGTRLPQQHLITAMSDADAKQGIVRIDLRVEGAGGRVKANGAVLEAIAKADAIVFGPGSFYSSVLPHLLIEDIVPAICRNVSALKVMIANVLECKETRGRTLSDLLAVFATGWDENGGQGHRALDLVIANRQLFPFEKSVGSTPYLAGGELSEASGRLGCRIRFGEYEDAWQRGHHDGAAVAETLIQALDEQGAASATSPQSGD